MLRRRETTYKTPTPKTKSNRSFWRAGSCRERMTGMGMTKRTMSVTTLTPAMIYHTVSKFRQWPGTAGFQKDSTGLQTRGNMMQSAIPQAPRAKRKPRMIFRWMAWKKIRRYCRRMDVLVSHTATL